MVGGSLGVFLQHGGQRLEDLLHRLQELLLMGVPEPHLLQNAANAEFAGMRNAIAAIEREGNITDQKRRSEWPRQGGVIAS
jgi:hypothetical protein